MLFQCAFPLQTMSIVKLIRAYVTYLFMYLCLFARREHRPSPKERPFVLFEAVFPISLLMCPISFVSLSVSLSVVPWPSSSPLPWVVPSDGLTGDGFWQFHMRLSYPTPFYVLHLIVY